MRAAVIDRQGGSEVLELREVADPAAAAGELLVRVEACAVNRVDVDLRSGTTRARLIFPHILGREVAGTVAALGPGVEGWSTGERVLVLPMWPCGRCSRCLAHADNLCTRGRQPGISSPGGYAELMTAPADHVFRLGPTLGFEEASASLISFGTAWRLLVSLAELKRGETVLVCGAAGGLGGAAVQVAALLGAHVIAAAGSASKLEGLRELGAFHLVDYSHGALAQQVNRITGDRGVDVLVEQMGGPLFSEALQALSPRARIVVAGALAGEQVTLDLVSLYLNEWRIYGSRSQRRTELEAVFERIEAGRLRPRIGGRLPLTEVGEAHRRLENRQVTGKIVLLPGT